MNFNNHWNLEETHAPFSASQSSWLRYSDDKLLSVFHNLKAKERGTRLHEWAKETILLGIKQSRSNKTICAYVNDAIGFKMQPEVVLRYSDYFFGTADAISFKNGMLRIHDLKTGKSGHMEQLYVYAALFCLEYDVKPGDITIECRLYIEDTVEVERPTAEVIVPIMDKIVYFNELLEKEAKKGA